MGVFIQEGCLIPTVPATWIIYSRGSSDTIPTATRGVFNQEGHLISNCTCSMGYLFKRVVSYPLYLLHRSFIQEGQLIPYPLLQGVFNQEGHLISNCTCSMGYLFKRVVSYPLYLLHGSFIQEGHLKPYPLLQGGV